MSAANKTYRESEKALQKMTLRQQQHQQRRHDASSIVDNSNFPSESDFDDLCAKGISGARK